MATKHFTIFTDGASRGNPGPAAVAYVIQREGLSDVRYSDTIGTATNNVAEYTAMLRALSASKEMRAATIRLNSDSELMVKQLRGEYRVKHPDMVPLYQEARELVGSFNKVEFVHIPRELNSEADRLCNEALNGNATTPVVDTDDDINAECTAPAQPPEVSEALQLLSSVREKWTHGKGPSVEAVWEELLALLKRHKLLKTRRTRSSR